MLINNETRLFLSASAHPSNFGVTVYNTLFGKLGLNAVYLCRKVTDAHGLIHAIRTLDVAGCSVSMPLKRQVIPHLAELDPLAKELQSVNTIIHKDGQLKGFNTDVFGVQNCITQIRPLHRVLIYGAGSVTSSIVRVLKQECSAEVFFLARRPEQARAMAAQYGVRSVESASEIKEHFDLVINATPASAQARSAANEELYRLLDHAPSFFDLVVSPVDTPWVTEAKHRKHHAISGIEMAIYQFQKQFELYTGLLPQISDVRTIVKKYMNARHLVQAA